MASFYKWWKLLLSKLPLRIKPPSLITQWILGHKPWKTIMVSMMAWRLNMNLHQMVQGNPSRTKQNDKTTNEYNWLTFFELIFTLSVGLSFGSIIPSPWWKIWLSWGALGEPNCPTLLPATVCLCSGCASKLKPTGEVWIVKCYQVNL